MSIQNSHQISDIKTMLVKGMNGEGIESIEKTATEGFIDTYTITYTDGTKTTFDVTNGNWGIWTSAVTAAVSATSVTINNDAIGTTSILEVYSQNASGTVITVNDIDVTPGTAVLTFPALAEATDFILHIVNGTASGGGGGGGGTTDYLDLSNKPQINGNTLTGNKTSGDLGIPNIFQGTIAEWNQLTTAEKKAYDHASIPDSIDGGVTFPANKVIMTGGGNVEDAVDGAAKKAETATDITMTPSDGITILSRRIMKMDKLVIAQLKIQWSTPTTHEYQIITFNGFNVGGNYAVGVVADANTNTIGTFVLSGYSLFIKLSASGITSNTVLCMTVIGFTT